MSDCAACHGVEGALHTCAGSGTYVAAEAHVAGEVDEISLDWTRFQVTLHFQVRALDESMVREKLTPLVSSLLSDDLVENADFSVVEHDGPKVAA